MNLIERISDLIAKESDKINQRPENNKVPVSGKIFDVEEIKNLIEAVLDCHWTEGHFTEKFESLISNYIGQKFALAVNSGSSANLLAVMSLTSHLIEEKRRLKQGDEIITTACCFPTTVFPIIQAGAIPVFIDVDIPNYNVNIEQLRSAITEKTKAIILAHTLGNPFNIKEVVRIAKENNLWLIEDNCDGLGSKYGNKMTGSFGDLATLSFYPAHHITTGEGGMVLTSNPELRKVVLSLRDWGRDCYCRTGKENTCGQRFSNRYGDLPFGYDHKYVYSHIGYNLKMTDLNAAIGVAQFKKLERFISIRKDNFKAITEHLKEYSGRLIMPAATENSQPSWFGIPLLVKGFNRIDIVKYLENRSIATRQLFAGNLTKQPVMTENNVEYRISGKLINTDRIMNDCFWVGCYPGINEERRKYMLDAFDDFFSRICNT